jgi:aminoglycoside phosphotransferase (APT) family kinase protein
MNPSGLHHLRANAIQWIEEAVGPGAQVVSASPQGGATSSTLHVVKVRYKSRTLSLVLRRFTNQEWLSEEPDLATHEAASLRKARAAGIPVPEMLAFDLDGAEVGEPAILMTRLPGRVVLFPEDFEDWLHQQAEILPRLHSLDPGDFPWRYAPYNDVTRLEIPAWSKHPKLWKRAIEIVNASPPASLARFIHRDYHPVNILWQAGKLSGVVDWPNACCGPACIDISWCRANLAALHGLEAADRFLQIYQSIMGVGEEYHPYWDLMVIIEILPGPPDVYPPWIEYGGRGLTDALMLEREDAYLASVMARF